MNYHDIPRRVEHLERLERGVSPGLFLAEHKALGGLVAYAGFSSINISTGALYDPTGYITTLSTNGSPVYSAINSIPYAILDGSTDYYSVTDAANISITGLESIFHTDVQGLTVGGWLYLDDATPASESTLWAKWNPTGNQRSFRLYVDTDGLVKFGVSVDGSAEVEIANETALETGRWTFAGASFAPGAAMRLLVDTEEVEDLTGIPASIFDSTANLNLGHTGGALLLAGGIASCFLYANQHSFSELRRLYEAGRFFFQQED